MFFFNLTATEFLALFSAASAAVVALYLLDRSRRQVVVSTLRFWSPAKRPVESTRRRRIRQWPSLLLQLASIAALLLALSQLRLGSRDTSARDHVLILDTSSWMLARVAADGPETLFDQTREVALRYLDSLPRTDRLLVLYADAIATPATPFETNRRNLREAIARAAPGTSGLNLQAALDYAVRLQGRENRAAGEIVFAGAGRFADTEGGVQAPRNLRVLPMDVNPDNAGLRKIGVRRATEDAGKWRVFVSVRNYTRRPMPVDLAVQFAGAPVATQRLNLAGGTEQEAAFDFRTRVAGVLEARIRARGDGFARDDRAVLELPAAPSVPVTVCSADPRALRPLLEAHPDVEARFLTPAQCEAGISEGVAIFDRCAPGGAAKVPAIYLDPPAAASPVPVRRTAGEAGFRSWNPNHPLAAGLRAQDLRLGTAQVLAPGKDDEIVAESSAGPLIAAQSNPRRVVIGFHPMQPGLKFELSTPLLFANALRWVAPEGLRRFDLFAGSTGLVQVPLESEQTGQIRVLDESGAALPYSLRQNTIRFFSPKPGTVRVLAGDREHVYSLTLPEVPDALWQPAAGVKRGVPRPGETGSPFTDIWYWLALAGGLGLLYEWLRYAPRGHRRAAAVASQEGGPLLRRAS
jgi:hypothetical protein